jgi:hypothetical protein
MAVSFIFFLWYVMACFILRYGHSLWKKLNNLKIMNSPTKTYFPIMVLIVCIYCYYFINSSIQHAVCVWKLSFSPIPISCSFLKCYGSFAGCVAN